MKRSNLPTVIDAMAAAEHYMRRALELARRGEGRTRPNPPVGAVLVCGGKVVGEGFHPAAGEPHAEIFALHQAGETARGGDLYVTLEPCSHHGRTGPCCEAVIAAGITRVIVGSVDPNPLVSGRGIARLREAGITVEVGILETDCRRLIAPFAKHVTTGLPLVILKSALTLDGRTATSSGDSQWISGPESRTHVHRVRDRVDAIMVGIGTVIKDDPRLTTRLPEGGRDPVRIVVDSSLRIPEDAALLHLQSDAPTILVTTESAPVDKIDRLQQAGHQIWIVPSRNGQVDLHAMLARAGEAGLQSIVLEGGSRLNAAFFQSGLIDRVMFFLAPILLGGDDGKGLFSGAGVRALDDATRLRDIRISRFGDDILVEGEVSPCSQD